jgi:hypothetical protein
MLGHHSVPKFVFTHFEFSIRLPLRIMLLIIEVRKEIQSLKRSLYLYSNLNKWRKTKNIETYFEMNVRGRYSPEILIYIRKL